MEITPQERARRKMELRPGEPKPNDDMQVVDERPRPNPNPQFERAITPEQRAKIAIGLHPDDPMPRPENLSPQMQEALAKIDPNLSAQIMGVMGCMERFQEKTRALADNVQKNMGSAIERTQKTSFTQRAIIRRAHRGTLGQKDVELARGIIEEQGRRGAIDPRQEGLVELSEQREELMYAFEDMQRMIVAQIPRGVDKQADEVGKSLAIVEQSLSQEAGNASAVVDQMWDDYHQSDAQRIQAIVKGQSDVRIDQASTHKLAGA